MINFALELVEEIVGDIKFYYLIRDGVNLFADSKEEVLNKNGKFESQFDSIQSRMLQIANKELLPKAKFRKLKSLDNCYEIKTRDLRSYHHHDKEHGIVLLSRRKKETKVRFDENEENSKRI
jgi:hypothetical protein